MLSLEAEMRELKSKQPSEIKVAVDQEMARLVAKIDQLKSELKQEIKTVDINRAAVSFKFELDHVADLFAFGGNRRSNTFWCQGLQWSIAVSTKRFGVSNYLSVFLHCHNDERLNWSCYTEFDLILFSYSPEVPNMVGKSKRTFYRSDSFGYPYYISYFDMLLSGTSVGKIGYIKNDKIVVGVELKAQPVARN